ncbi:fungal-specific transcription factor domain-containing protein [Amylocarpus encephaloides]|uniref:Fungal-specific transcription factor domain-containing protein n=1 Tax=Amylocarpus encephaloides TaxID=45428 RepID=A0A9P7YDX2_9HELO|nr:fungal-specific transcription factor domain-containing protein [Amylocarpus encephaloides]
MKSGSGSKESGTHAGNNEGGTSPANSNHALSNPRRAPKSRNGCLRCKAKRLKCDEKKPECVQCSRKNLPCPGYKTKSLVWSTKHEKLLAPQAGLSWPGETPIQVHGEEKENPRTELDVIEEPCMTLIAQEAPGVAPRPPTPEPPPLCHRANSTQSMDSLSAIRQQLHRSTVPEFLHHLPTMLVEYYFNYVCQIFSSFDGMLNPFRSTVGRLWDGSAPIYYAIQSMAAAYLANHFPRMNQVGVQMQRETYRCLYQIQQGSQGQAENLDKSLLTVLLIGQTTAWHDPKDLGLVHLKTAKRLNKRRREQQSEGIGVREQRQNEFFEQCILYWDMLAGFVKDDVDDSGLPDFDILMEESSPAISTPSSTSSSEKMEMVFPHPWTGVSPKAQRLFSQVGRLIRSYRKRMAQDVASLDFLSLDLAFDLDFPGTTADQALTKAQSLEEELLAFEPPPIYTLVDAGDENTPVQQYILLAEAYRCAALLQIYRVFPSILQLRVPDTTCEFGIFSLPQNPFGFLPETSSLAPQDFLLSLALHTISLLEKIPENSGTRCLQPIVLLAAASELHFSPSTSSNDPFSAFLLPPPSASTFTIVTNREIDIAEARKFAVGRFQAFCRCMPEKPHKNALAVVEETWRREDAGQGRGVYWMDVMEEMGAETIFG